ncbi:MAG: Holliday junction ATP-dependent DNA helicase RuvA [Myxococcales bacterium]
MIAFLRGRVAAVEDEHADIDVGGVGYRVIAPAGTLGRLAAATGEVTVLTHMHVREDAMLLYGFLDAAEREMFLLLLGVTGIGPKLAIGILGGIGVAELVDCVVREDLRQLQKVPGVGKKLAERMLLELRGKTPASALPAPARPAARGGVWDDLRSALINLGYKATAVEKAVEALQGQGEARPFQELLRDALRMMG